MRKSDLKVETEALIFAAQEQALKINVMKCNIEKTGSSPLCKNWHGRSLYGFWH